MVEVLEFIFQDLLHFIGTLILLECIFGGIRGFVTVNHHNHINKKSENQNN